MNKEENKDYSFKKEASKIVRLYTEINEKAEEIAELQQSLGQRALKALGYDVVSFNNGIEEDDEEPEVNVLSNIFFTGKDKNKTFCITLNQHRGEIDTDWDGNADPGNISYEVRCLLKGWRQPEDFFKI